MARGGGETRWFDIDPCYVFHVGNAHVDDAGRVSLDVVRYDRAGFASAWPRLGGAPTGTSMIADGFAHRWLIDPTNGVVKEHALDDRAVEFPTLNEQRVGRPNRFLYSVGQDAIVKYDSRTGESRVRTLDSTPGEAIFVAAPGARSEDDGWLISIVTDKAGSGSELLVLAAADLDTVARVSLPRRVPAGFHGSWLVDE